MYPPFLQIYHSVWCQKIKTFFFVLISSYFVFTFIDVPGLANPRYPIHGGIYRSGVNTACSNLFSIFSHKFWSRSFITLITGLGEGVHVCVYVLIHCLFSPRCILTTRVVSIVFVHRSIDITDSRHWYTRYQR